MKKSTIKKAALYDPYLDVMGGGERYILSILQVLEQERYELTIFWDEDVEEDIEEKLNLTFEKLTFQKNIFKHDTSLRRLKTLANYDLFLYVTDGSYMFSSAKKNIIYAMVPQKDLYNRSVPNRIKMQNFQFITHSTFTQKWLRTWGIPTEVIYPYLPPDLLNIDIKSQTKEKMIISVGRFFPHLHSKRHDIAIDWFKDLQKKGGEFADYTLHLIGNVKEEDELYFHDLQELAGDNTSIHFHPNLSFDELLAFYQKALFYWHFAGYEVDEKEHPERVEHLGITPLEAMAAGCITCAYAAGGPQELIIDGENGYLFLTQEELFKKMEDVQAKQETQQRIQKQAKLSVDTNFSFRTFRKRVKEVIL